jgi:DNA repair exonuclease SbcCD nuclease subunit
MRILHTADIHLRGEKDERWEALRKIIDLARDKKVSVVAISGDLFDRGVDAEKLRPQIRKLFSGIDFKIVLIPGNHDSESYRKGLHFGENIIIIDDPEKPLVIDDKDENVRIWGMPFQDLEREVMARRLQSLSHRFESGSTDILLYHGELLDSFYSRSDFGDEGKRKYMPVKLSFFRDLKVDYVLAGHFHARFSVWRLEQGGYFIYPGSPVSITRRETGVRKVNIFEIGREPQEHPLDTSCFERLEVRLDPFSGEKPDEKIRSAIDTALPHAKILLTVAGYINSDREGMTEKDLIGTIKKLGGNRLVDPEFEFRDIGRLLENSLFRSFEDKLRQSELDPEDAGRVREVAIRAMMEAGQ